MLAAPLPVGRLFGLPSRRPLLRALAARDVLIGAGLLGARNERPWLVVRAAADVFDAALMLSAARRERRSPAATAARVAFAFASAALSARASAGPR
jgi:hypothetical protein